MPKRGTSRTNVNRVTTILQDGTTRVFYYFRPPVGHMLPRGLSKRLPDDRDAADARAKEMLPLCVDYRKPRPPRLKKPQRIERVAIEVLKSARKRAKRYNIPFSLTEEDVSALLKHQGYRCALSGLRFSDETGAEAGCYRSPYRPSLDRIRPKLGYVRDNVRLVLVAVNVALSDWGEETLLEIARALASHHPDLQSILQSSGGKK